MVFQTFSPVQGIKAIIHGLADWLLLIYSGTWERKKNKKALTAGSLQVTARLGKKPSSTEYQQSSSRVTSWPWWNKAEKDFIMAKHTNSGSWWWTGRPGMLQSMGSQRVGHDWATELSWTETHKALCGHKNNEAAPSPGFHKWVWFLLYWQIAPPSVSLWPPREK